MLDPVSAHEFLIRDQVGSPARPDKAPAGGKGGPDFGRVLSDLVRETDDLQKAADHTLEDFAAGKVDDVHEVMVSMNKADLSFRMMLEIRNKLLDAYTEVMRTQV